MSLSLVNKLQAKLGSDESERRLDNLLRLSTTTSYNLKEEDRPWADLISGLELRPGPAVSMRWSARHDAYGGAIESSSITASFDLRGEPALVSAAPWEDRVAQSDSPAEQLLLPDTPTASLQVSVPEGDHIVHLRIADPMVNQFVCVRLTEGARVDLRARESTEDEDVLEARRRYAVATQERPRSCVK